MKVYIAENSREMDVVGGVIDLGAELVSEQGEADWTVDIFHVETQTTFDFFTEINTVNSVAGLKEKLDG